MTAAERGFSLIEMLVAIALTLAVMAGVFGVLNPSQPAFAAESEAADMQQRLRVAADTLSTDLMMAGAGADQGPRAGPLTRHFPPVLPYGLGPTSGDSPGSFTADRITVVYVLPGSAQSTLTAPLDSATAVFATGTETGCAIDPGSDRAATLCGFARNQTVLVYDGTGNYGLFTIEAVANGVASVSVKNGSGHVGAFPAGSTIVVAANHTYYARADPVGGTGQLVHSDGTPGADVPVVDHVVALRFDYYGDPQPPVSRGAIDDPSAPATTYGPAPTVGAASCIFSAATPPAPLLPALGDGGQALVPLSAAELTDGPFCPDDIGENRWDADLLRIRRISVTLRVQAAAAALRGPAGLLFTHGGTSRAAGAWVPDHEVRFDVSPRNLNLAR